MPDTIKLTVKCFSHIRHVLQKDELHLELPAGSTGADLEKQIRNLAPDRLNQLPLRIAVNREFVNPSHPLNDGDEVALIPPVQGG